VVGQFNTIIDRILRPAIEAGLFVIDRNIGNDSTLISRTKVKMMTIKAATADIANLPNTQ
jgi:hypothetical protein